MTDTKLNFKNILEEAMTTSNHLRQMKEAVTSRPLQISHQVARVCGISMALLPWWILAKGEATRLELGAFLTWLVIGFLAWVVRDNPRVDKPTGKP